jgi:Fe-S-cluster-containing dehydrogenase component/formate-dependent nitrite reductase membrane component NrfD
MGDGAVAAEETSQVRWGKVVDHEKCIGCHACTTACKSENEVPLSVTRTYVKYVDVGTFPEAHRAFQVTRCNQCEDSPCTTACPTASMHRRPDGIVDFDKSICIGCKACIAACPYDAIFINPDDHSAEKCNFCAHRIDVGLEPACVVVCPTESILIGDLNDVGSRVSQIVNRDNVSVRRPEKETRPKLFYKGAGQATLDPLAAQRPEGDIFMWAQQLNDSQHVVSGHPEPANSSAAAVLAYDVPHRIPWDWKVSLYTLTKGVSTGVYLLAALLVNFGVLESNGSLWLQVVPLIALTFLGLTGLLLIADLKHPARFYMIFTRPQWQSWLTRGAFLISGYGLAIFVHAIYGLRGVSPPNLVVYPGAGLALLVAIYTAYLFAQAKARDLWQSPLLPPHLAVQAVLSGAATLWLVAPTGDLRSVLGWILVGASAVHLFFLVGELTLTHGTAHARLAVHEMTRGRYASFFWTGFVLVALSCATPVLGAPAAAGGLLGILCYEHAFVQAGQSVPLA